MGSQYSGHETGIARKVTDSICHNLSAMNSLRETERCRETQLFRLFT